MDSQIEVVSCFVFDQQGRLLLLRRHWNDWGGGLWATPAGKIERAETPEAAIFREVQEETGIQLANVEFLGSHYITMPHSSVRMGSFKSFVDSTEGIRLQPDEHEAHAWFSLETLVEQPNIIWATPTILRDFGLLSGFNADPTLVDGSTAVRQYFLAKRSTVQPCLQVADCTKCLAGKIAQHLE